MKRLRSLVSVGRTTQRGASSMRMVVGSMTFSPSCFETRSLEPVFLLAPRMGAGDERRLDACLLDVGERRIEGGLVNQGAALGGYRDIARHRVRIAQVAATRIERAAC